MVGVPVDILISGAAAQNRAVRNKKITKLLRFIIWLTFFFSVEFDYSLNNIYFHLNFYDLFRFISYEWLLGRSRILWFSFDLSHHSKIAGNVPLHWNEGGEYC